MGECGAYIQNLISHLVTEGQVKENKRHRGEDPHIPYPQCWIEMNNRAKLKHYTFIYCTITYIIKTWSANNSHFHWERRQVLAGEGVNVAQVNVVKNMWKQISFSSLCKISIQLTSSRRCRGWLRGVFSPCGSYSARHQILEARRHCNGWRCHTQYSRHGNTWRRM